MTLGLVAAFGLQKNIYDKLKVTGPTYSVIVDSKDLLADILPPPLYVVESYMLANENVVHPTLVEQNSARIRELQGEYETRRRYWLDSSYQKELVNHLSSGILKEGEAYWQTMTGAFLPAVEAGDFDAATIALDELRKSFLASDAAVKSLVTEVSEFDEDFRGKAASEDSFYSVVTLAASVVSVIVFLVGLFIFRQRAIVPLTAMKDYMRVLSDGDFSRDVPYAERTDEIGEMAQSVAFFRDTAIERDSVRAQGETVRKEKEAQDAATAARKAEEDAERVKIIEALSRGLENLSAGNLTYRITEPFAPEYMKLRNEFNASIEKLNSTLSEIAETTDSVRQSSSELGSAADDLSKRT
ncbi:HAMP domain-containing protein [Hoeflea halophila]|uniref:HAMP domain-containing protein n=1 Tax=Hoeflea halophila TaxID=714899 RepID=UPI001FCE739E|nr:methyl-accepting chemotaxis protein [Hoeflea halophila]